MNKETEMAIFLDNFFYDWSRTGSRYICNPPVMDTDEDFVCFHPSRLQTLSHMHESGWTWTNNSGGHYKDMGDFLTFRKDHYNLIVADNSDFFDLFVAATNVAKIRNILDKQDRINLFQCILYGRY